MRRSLRLKVALALFAATVVLLVAQAVGVRALAEAQEERLIQSVIADDMRDLVRDYRNDPAALPPFDPVLRARVSQEGGLRTALPAALATLAPGVHEVLVGGREVHVAVATVGGERLFRVYDYSAYEQHFRDGIDALVAGTAFFVLPSLGLAFWLSGLLVRQVAGLARQVRDLRSGAASTINPGRYDEREVAELADAVNDYHRRMAAMVEREKEFTADVSHELRTPLTAIRTSCELLEPVAATLDAKSRQRLLQIEDAAEHMRALVDSLLALARAEGGGAVTRVALAPLIERVLATFAERMAQRAIATDVAVDGAASVPADASALGIVVANLVDNAVRHTEGGTIAIRYFDGALSITDTGCGIAADALPHVFDRHYRAPGGRGEGFGIGLAVVKRICERYGWTIAMASDAGGTRVTLGLAASAGILHENFTRC